LRSVSANSLRSLDLLDGAAAGRERDAEVVVGEDFADGLGAIEGAGRRGRGPGEGAGAGQGGRVRRGDGGRHGGGGGGRDLARGAEDIKGEGAVETGEAEENILAVHGKRKGGLGRDRRGARHKADRAGRNPPDHA
jgi:hypothetical protein